MFHHFFPKFNSLVLAVVPPLVNMAFVVMFSVYIRTSLFDHPARYHYVTGDTPTCIRRIRSHRHGFFWFHRFQG
ncbi:hypothetical protein AYI69_g8702 [Smittium culicis]|uniref:Uncharacterized protein n=1 Tax=Smittium culicis TaxID=133412 RepID=A0A1R1XHS6_9FUNG|nr:hypothetical protein AYI69_g8702 [Smittium culicis]